VNPNLEEEEAVWGRGCYHSKKHWWQGAGGWPLGYEERRCWANCSHN